MTAASPAGALVIFGISGDLARKMTFRALYRLEKLSGHLDCPVIGVAGTTGPTTTCATTRARPSRQARRTGTRLTPTPPTGWPAAWHTCRGISADPATYDRLRERLDGRPAPVFYLEIPPALFAPVVTALARAGLTEGARVVVEKPFGHDLASARQLNSGSARGDRRGADPAHRSLSRQAARA